MVSPAKQAGTTGPDPSTSSSASAGGLRGKVGTRRSSLLTTNMKYLM